MPITYFATNRKQGDGSTTAWDFSFAGARPDANNGTAPYLETDDVRVALVEVTPDGEELREEIAFTFGPGPSQVTIEPAVADGQDFVIYRETESEIPVADFTDFAAIDEQDLDNTARQTLFTVQELQDRVADTNANSVRASATANQATVTANEASATAGTALSTANSANSTATQAQSAASNAVSTANAANSTANAANATANTALSNAADAQDAVAGAVSTANSAQTAAAQAVSTANTANSTANSAQTAASNAQTVANNAAGIANTASTNAATALSTANAASATAGTADSKADQALEAAGLIVNFQEQLDQIQATVEDLTGVGVEALTRNEDNLSKLTDFAAARTNLSVYSKAEVDSSQSAQDSLIADQGSRLSTVESTLPNKADKATVLTAGDGLTGGGDLSTGRSFAVDSSVVRTSRTVAAGNGLTGGGALSADRTVTLGTPGTLSGATTNAVTASSHTHALDATTARNKTTGSQVLLAPAMGFHINSGDHDGRYYQKADVDARAELVTVGAKQLRRTPPENICRFQVYKSTNQSLVGTSGSQKVTFTTLTSGRESVNSMWYYPTAWYSTSLHRFIAPVSGVYRLYYALLNDNIGLASNLNTAFGVNGVILETTGPRNYEVANVNNSGVFGQVQADAVFYLNAGDYVEVFCTENDIVIQGATTARYSYFGGYLM